MIELECTHCLVCGQKVERNYRVGGFLSMRENETVSRVHAVRCENCKVPGNRWTYHGEWEPRHGLRALLRLANGTARFIVDLLDSGGAPADKLCHDCGHVYAPTCNCREVW